MIINFIKRNCDLRLEPYNSWIDWGFIKRKSWRDFPSRFKWAGVFSGMYERHFNCILI